MLSHFRHDVEKLELIPASGGAFEVTVNGKKLYSKLDSGEFPDADRFIASMEESG
ncbi:SelT/SelW/SelH family protein [Alteribacter natronophilus]|nr:SelT/SelW/SelH family protein [Alteribacter natronophilus]